jgi:hypothetical protein
LIPATKVSRPFLLQNFFYLNRVFFIAETGFPRFEKFYRTLTVSGCWVLKKQTAQPNFIGGQLLSGLIVFNDTT